MKKKMLLPLLAVLFALAGAFASEPVVQQMAWFKSGSNPAQQGEITTPVDTSTNPCSIGGSIQCKVDILKAYDTEAHANASPDPEGLLKYN